MALEPHHRLWHGEASQYGNSFFPSSLESFGWCFGVVYLEFSTRVIKVKWVDVLVGTAIGEVVYIVSTCRNSIRA